MIVICTGCQARFRVADEKVGPRGAKVRCSRCQTVFVVKRDSAPPASVELDLTPGLGGPSPGRARPAPAPGGGAVIPFPVAAAQPRPPPPDPFAAAGLDAFGDPGPAGGDDPFARAMAPPGAPASPAMASGLGQPASLPPDDPFAPAAAPAPLGGFSTGTTGAQSLAVTDLSQLLGTPAPPLQAPAAAPAPTPPPLAEEPEPQLGRGPSGPAEPELGFEAQFAAHTPPPIAPRVGAAVPQQGAPGFPADLALEEHSAEHQAPFADPADVMMSADGGGFGGAAFEQGPLGSLSGPEESLALATEPTPGAAEERPEPPSPVARPAPEPAPRRAAPAPAPEEEDRLQAGLGRPGLAVAHRLRPAAVNALALVVLLAIALGFRVVLRGDASLGPSVLRPSTLLRAVRRAPARAGDLEVAAVRSGVYPQSSGGTVLFVRGEVVSRAPGPVGSVRVAAELVRAGEVLARGEARAGAVPTPEELDRAADRAALDELAVALGKRAPRVVAPGDRLEFLVTLGDAPADASGASVRVHAEAEGAGK